jgi:glycine betaine/choline ABC-type transport system substrate-binding protein
VTDAAVTRRELQVIRDDLHCTAVSFRPGWIDNESVLIDQAEPGELVDELAAASSQRHLDAFSLGQVCEG